ncbi:MAG: phosphatase PAP2 family protein [Paraglaciecola sp.]|nr:phosphatase PAP2 family protein [Paraglaciecola sp.]NCT49658.1 phosphatase PAP2 family protein [Paraglaciecola sp.]
MMPAIRFFSPALYGLLAVIFMQYSGADQWLAAQIFHVNDAWAWRENFWLNDVLHVGGRKLLAAVLSLLVIYTALSYAFAWWQRQQRAALLYACVASLLAMLIVTILKHVATLPCPWHVLNLGGDQSYLQLHQMFASNLAAQQCFPAGHASGGFALFSVYFAAKLWFYSTYKPRRISRGWLLPAIGLGLAFGIAQQLRGAHFLSHDITTAVLCWYTCAFMWLGASKMLGQQTLSIDNTTNKAETRFGRQVNKLLLEKNL